MALVIAFTACSPEGNGEDNKRETNRNGIQNSDNFSDDMETSSVEKDSDSIPSDNIKPEPNPTPPQNNDSDNEGLFLGIGMSWGNWLGFGFGDEAKKFDRLSMNKIAELGANATTANFAWIDIEGSPGVYDWSYADHQVNEARQRNLDIFAYIGLTPDWALDKSTIAHFSPGIGYRYPPADKYQGAFEMFMEETARRYRGKVKRYKFWNEPNGCSWVADNCSNGNYNSAALYTKWLKIAYKALKKGNPEALVSIGGLDYNTAVSEHEHSGATPFLEHLYTAGAKGFFDAVTLHPYGNPLNFDALIDNFQILKDHGDENLPIWIGEYGWQSRPSDISEEMKKESILQILSQLKTDYPYVSAINYLVLTDLPNENGADDFCFGLCSRYLDKLDSVLNETDDTSVIKCRISAEAITVEGVLYCWGRDNFGQIGDGNPDTSNQKPTNAVSGAHVYRDIFMGYSTACGINSNQQVVCWGDNSLGQIGVGDQTDYGTPQSVTDTSGGYFYIRSVSSHANHTCTSTVSGDIFCFGERASYKIGDNSTAGYSLTAYHDADSAVVEVSVGTQFTCYRNASGIITCDGNNAYHQLGANLSTGSSYGNFQTLLLTNILWY